MFTFLHSTLFLMLLSGWLGVFGMDKPQPKQNPDLLKYYNASDTLGISCIYDDSMDGFYQENISRFSNFSATLVERLNNGKPLSLYVDGVVSRLKPIGSTFRFAKEWAKASNTNVCYLTYAYENIPQSTFAIIATSREMVRSRRSLYAAKVGSDLVINIRNHCEKNGLFGCWVYMSKVTVLGFSFGAHIASQICINLYKKTGQKVGKLVGIDPAGIYLILNRFKHAFINRGDATYVQIIHTDIVLFGTIFQTGDVDIYIQDIPVSMLGRHGFGPYIHMATSMKKLFLIAETDGGGKIIPIDEKLQEKDVVLHEDEVYVGVYSQLEESKRGKKYFFSLKGRISALRDSIAHVVKMYLQGGSIF